MSPRKLAPWLALGAVAAAAAISCSGSGGATSQGSGGSGGAGTTSSSGTQTTSGTGADDIGFDAGQTSSSSGGVDLDAGCAGEATKAVLLPLDMFIMLDRSGSMLEPVAGGGTKWDAIKAALQTFLTQPGLATSGISVGIQYFGQPASKACPASCNSDADCGLYGPCSAKHTCTSCGNATSSCFASDYAKADVDIAPLHNPQIIDLLTSIQAQNPDTNTPTSAALQGALDYCTAWAQDPARANHVVVNVFATDGEPSECVMDQSTINGIAAAAANANPKILTFVIGVGSALTKLDGIAAAGGTAKAFLLDTANPNVQSEFLAALNAIRGTALGCTYKIPQNDGGMVDLNKVNVEYTPGNGGASEQFPKYQDAAHCPATGDGWYYDDNGNPTQILLCKNTCSKVGKDTMGAVNIVVGCQTKLPG
jgi:hypothetical protein